MPTRDAPAARHPDHHLRARLAAVLNASAEAIIDSTPDGTITGWNRAAERMYGYPAAEALGLPLTLIAGEGIGDLTRLLRRTAAGEEVSPLETVHAAKDGTPLPVRLAASPIRDEEGRVTSLCVVAHDLREATLARQECGEHLKYQERLHVALDAVGMGWCDMDTVTGRGIWSRRHFQLLGYPAPEAGAHTATIGMWQELILPEDRERVAGEVAKAQRLQTLFDSEHRVRRADSGDTLWVCVLGRFLDLNGSRGTRFIGVISDITPRKKGEAELEEARRLADQQAAEAQEGREILEALMEHMPDGVSICGANGRLLRVSRYVTDLLGIDEATLKALPLEERAEKLGIFYPDGVTRVPVPDLPLIRSLTSGELVRDCELVMYGARGKGIPVLVNTGPIRDREGRITGAVAAWRDNSARKAMEQRLKVSEERYRTLVEWAPDAVIVHRNGRFLYLNCPALGIYRAMSRVDLLERDFFEMVHPGDREAVRRQLSQIREGTQMHPHEFRMMRIDGSFVAVEAAGIIIEYEGEPAYLFIVRDISERKRLEQERLSAVEELRLSEQLLIKQGRFAAMGEMIANIAHQWRQPLNTLGLIVQELRLSHQAGCFDGEYLEASVRKAMQTIAHMSHTIDHFRNFFRPEKEKAVFEVAEVVRKAVALVEPAFAELQVALTLQLEQGLHINGFPNEYAQVVLNILMNARDVLLERNVEHPLVQLALFANDGRAVLTITDNAGGIDEEIIGRVFDPYFTTKSPDRGTGIGLFMSKTIIEKNMNGSLTVANVAGGAQFRIEV